jgi:TusA-related sulfurtransferase
MSFFLSWYGFGTKWSHKKTKGTIEMKPARTVATVDVRNLISPLSLLKVEDSLSQLARGDIMEVLCIDEETKSDLLDIMRNSKHRCHKVKREAGHFSLLIEKRGTGDNV